MASPTTNNSVGDGHGKNQCEFTETPVGNGLSEYYCPHCKRPPKILPAGLDPPLRRNCLVPAPTEGPGTELTALLKRLGVKPKLGCKCRARAREMDRRGIQWCRDNRQVIKDWLREAVAEANWKEVAKTGAKMLQTKWLRLRDPIGSVVDEAIRRAELQLSQRDDGDAH